MKIFELLDSIVLLKENIPCISLFYISIE